MYIPPPLISFLEQGMMFRIILLVTKLPSVSEFFFNKHCLASSRACLCVWMCVHVCASTQETQKSALSSSNSPACPPQPALLPLPLHLLTPFCLDITLVQVL